MNNYVTIVAGMNFTRKVLKNGIRLITVPLESIKSATVLVMVGAGSRYETRENNGISHFLEHMAFKGTDKRPSALAISSVIDSIGGEFNAFTGKELTGYYIKASSQYIELSLDILSDMLQNSKLDPKEIDKERGVILEEINMYEDTPMRKIGDIYERLLYGDTPMGWDIAGEKDNILKITSEDFRNYLNQLYSANNITVVVAGGIANNNIESLVEKYFDKIAPFTINKPSQLVINQKEPQVFIKNKTTEQVHIALGLRSVPLSHKDYYPFEVLAAFLGGGMSSKLFHEVREKKGLAYYVKTVNEAYTDGGSMVTFAGVDSKRVGDAISVILEIYRELKGSHIEKYISQEDLKKSKEYLKGHLVLELEDSRAVSNFFAQQDILENQILTPEEIITKIEAVTIEDIKHIIKKYFVGDNLNLAIIGNFANGDEFKNMLSL